jgi:hypothetical protein
MHGVRLSLTGTLVLTLVGWSSGIALGQSAQSVIDAADEQGVIFSTGESALDHIVDMGTQSVGADGVNRWRGLVALTIGEYTDPRLSGPATLTWNVDQYGDDLFDGPEWGTVHIENDGGAWRGTYTGFTYPDNDWEWAVVYLAAYAGEGGYEGLVANCHAFVPGGGWDAQHRCVVMPGDLADFRRLPAE